MSKSNTMEKSGSNEKSPATPPFLVREEQPDGVINVKPRFGSYLNYIFSNMSKQEKIALLKKSEEDQIDELKQLYKAEFIKMSIENQNGLIKKLSYNNGQYDDYKLVEFLTTNEKSVDARMQGYFNMANAFNAANAFNMGSKKSEDSRHKENPRQQLLYISQRLLQSQKGKYDNYEMEVKFGTKGIKMLTKQDYDNVVKKIKEIGFVPTQSDGYYCLKIQPEFMDIRTGEYKSSNDMDRFRVEINGLTNIQEYCRSDNIEQLLNTKTSQEVSIMKKSDVKNDEDALINSADFNEFNFRVTFKKEETVSKTSKIGLELMSNWNKSRKVYRYINRVTFNHPDYPFNIDLSIVRSSTKDFRGRLTKTYNVKESSVFQNSETYELEIEVKNEDAKLMYSTP